MKSGSVVFSKPCLRDTCTCIYRSSLVPRPSVGEGGEGVVHTACIRLMKCGELVNF